MIGVSKSLIVYQSFIKNEKTLFKSMHNINKELTVTIVSVTQQPIIGNKETSIVYGLIPTKCPLNTQPAFASKLEVS